MGNAAKVVHVTIEQCEDRIDAARSLANLLNNPDFVRVIKRDYMEREAHRLTLLLADPSCETPQGQANVMRDLSAIAQLHSYFNTVRVAGEVAQRTKDDHEEEERIRLKEESEE